MAKLIVKDQCCIDKSIIKAAIAHNDGSRIIFDKTNNGNHYDGCFIYGDLAMHNKIVNWINSTDDTNLTIG